MVKKEIFLILLVLSACTTDSTPDEDFEAPTSDFPFLGTVPDRPSFPQINTLNRQKERLQTEHNEATEQAKALTPPKNS